MCACLIHGPVYISSSCFAFGNNLIIIKISAVYTKEAPLLHSTTPVLSALLFYTWFSSQLLFVIFHQHLNVHVFLVNIMQTYLSVDFVQHVCNMFCFVVVVFCWWLPLWLRACDWKNLGYCHFDNSHRFSFLQRKCIWLCPTPQGAYTMLDFVGTLYEIFYAFLKDSGCKKKKKKYNKFLLEALHADFLIFFSLLLLLFSLTFFFFFSNLFLFVIIWFSNSSEECFCAIINVQCFAS